MRRSLSQRRHAQYLLALLFCLIPASMNAGRQMDFANAIVHAARTRDRVFDQALNVLIEQVSRRTGTPLKIQRTSLLPDYTLAILSQNEDSRRRLTSMAEQIKNRPAPDREGFHLQVSAHPTPAVLIQGRDNRGALYGIGRLLRTATLKKDVFTLPLLNLVNEAPCYPLRGHQLGYRPKTNAYDAWSVGQFDQYVRELALFGANCIEIMPPATDDDPSSPHMQLSTMEMMVEQSRIAAAYGLEVWVWYPNMAKEYNRPEVIERELADRDMVFSRLVKLDAVFVPGGDPGELHPDVLFPWLEKTARVLHRYHPQAKIWVSPQAARVKQEWLEAFYRHANQRYPWFGGVVFGPWVKTKLSDLRAILDPAIPIRHYPDITHSLSCQYPVPLWDPAFALTLGRECYNPRPVAEKAIHNVQAPYCIGSISYSEGINDDINKFIWSGQDWDPQTPVIATLREVARLLIHPDYSEEIAQGLLALEQNWQSPLISNEQVGITLQQWQDLEQRVPRSVRANYRFQMGLLRAYFDAYVQKRLVDETHLENQALELLSNADAAGLNEAIKSATAVLLRGRSQPVASNWHKRCWELADSLFLSIGSQLSVAKHGAMPGRGDFMDDLDVPLNNSLWLLDRLQSISCTADPDEKLDRLNALIQRTNPGPGGFYDNMGSASSFARVQPQPDPLRDPGGLFTSQRQFEVNLSGEAWSERMISDGWNGRPIPLAWLSQIGTLYDQPLQVHYDNLDSLSAYRLRICYTGRFKAKIRCLTDDGFLVHDYLQTGDHPLHTFDLPRAATSDGRIDLIFSCAPGERGTQISEIWLMRKP
ncbi:hypothetical protein GX408_00670 [bacterium]|nr:hypothetical protein [bacterium]